VVKRKTSSVRNNRPSKVSGNPTKRRSKQCRGPDAKSKPKVPPTAPEPGPPQPNPLADEARRAKARAKRAKGQPTASPPPATDANRLAGEARRAKRAKGQPTASPAPATDAAGKPAPGLDEAKHAAAQKSAAAAEVLRDSLYPHLLSDSIGAKGAFDAATCQAYLEQFIADMGSPGDPIERMMFEQLAISHFRIGQMHVRANKAQSVEVEKAFNAAACRLMGELRRTADTVRSRRKQVPEGTTSRRLKMFKAAE